jgi:hypothetical protein
MIHGSAEIHYLKMSNNRLRGFFLSPLFLSYKLLNAYLTTLITLYYNFHFTILLLKLFLTLWNVLSHTQMNSLLHTQLNI